MLSWRLTQKIRISTESPNQFDKKFLGASEENLNVKSCPVTPCHTSHILDSTCREVKEIPSCFGLDRSYNASKRQKYITTTEINLMLMYLYCILKSWYSAVMRLSRFNRYDQFALYSLKTEMKETKNATKRMEKITFARNNN